MLFPIMIAALLCYRNAQRAARKGLKPGKWAVLTFLAFFTGIFLGSFILACIIMYKHPEMVHIRNQQQMVALLMKNQWEAFLYMCLVFAGGMGGHLLIRYLIDKKGVNNPQ